MQAIMLGGFVRFYHLPLSRIRVFQFTAAHWPEMLDVSSGSASSVVLSAKMHVETSLALSQSKQHWVGFILNTGLLMPHTGHAAGKHQHPQAWNFVMFASLLVKGPAVCDV